MSNAHVEKLTKLTKTKQSTSICGSSAPHCQRRSADRNFKNCARRQFAFMTSCTLFNCSEERRKKREKKNVNGARTFQLSAVATPRAFFYSYSIRIGITEESQGQGFEQRNRIWAWQTALHCTARYALPRLDFFFFARGASMPHVLYVYMHRTSSDPRLEGRVSLLGGVVFHLPLCATLMPLR